MTQHAMIALWGIETLILIVLLCRSVRAVRDYKMALYVRERLIDADDAFHRVVRGGTVVLTMTPRQVGRIRIYSRYDAQLRITIE